MLMGFDAFFPGHSSSLRRSTTIVIKPFPSLFSLFVKDLTNHPSYCLLDVLSELIYIAVFYFFSNQFLVHFLCLFCL